jgi:PAS domain S-box-containing protein
MWSFAAWKNRSAVVSPLTFLIMVAGSVGLMLCTTVGFGDLSNVVAVALLSPVGLAFCLGGFFVPSCNVFGLRSIDLESSSVGEWWQSQSGDVLAQSVLRRATGAFSLFIDSARRWLTGRSSEIDQMKAEIERLASESAQLRKRVNRLNLEHKEILNMIPIGIVTMGEGRIVEDCNLAYTRILRCKEEEIIGKVAPLPEGEWKTWNIWEQELRTGKGFVDQEATRLRIDGSEFSATLSGKPVFNEDGIYAKKMIGVIRDNTNQYAQATQLQIFSSLAEHSPDFVGVADLDGNPIVINRAGQELYGIDGDEHVKRTHILDYFAASERARARDVLIPELVRDGKVEFETVGQNFRTGQTFDLDCTCFVIPDTVTAKPAYLAAVAKNATERKRVKERLRMFCSVVENHPYFVGVANMDLKPIYINPAGQKRFGLNGQEDVDRTDLFDLFPEEEHNRVRNELIPLLIKEKYLAREVAARNVKTGEAFPALWTAFVILDAKMQTPFLLAAVIKDITEENQVREELDRRDETNRLLLEQVRALQEQTSKDYSSLQQKYISLEDEKSLILKEDTISTEMSKEIIGHSRAIGKVHDLIETLGPTDASVLIVGETGTGKELVARAIHMASKRADKPFKPLSVIEVTPELIAVALFGHEKGAYTSAEEKRFGIFELAEGGTVFLDELGELSLDAQGKLLRVLQEREFYRVGGAGVPIRTDVRVLAATSRNLFDMIKKGQFREDLYFRLKVGEILVPPLRERGEDIDELVFHFAQMYARKLGKDVSRIELRSMERLRSYDWPGNVRQLQNVIEFSVVLCKDNTLVVDEGMLPSLEKKRDQGSQLTMPLVKSRFEPQRSWIEAALRRSRGQIDGVGGAAEILSLPASTLRSRITRLQINVEKFRSETDPEKS